jgi:hypothetical protein
MAGAGLRRGLDGGGELRHEGGISRWRVDWWPAVVERAGTSGLGRIPVKIQRKNRFLNFKDFWNLVRL